jgi:hypothetical protein
MHCLRCNRHFISEHYKHVSATTVHASCTENTIGVNDLLRCDAMAQLIVSAHISTCHQCTPIRDSTIFLDIGEYNRFDKVLHYIYKRVYEGDKYALTASRLASNVLHKRCGADKTLIEAYLRAFPSKEKELQTHLMLRKKQQEKFTQLMEKNNAYRHTGNSGIG